MYDSYLNNVKQHASDQESFTYAFGGNLYSVLLSDMTSGYAVFD
jgi:hypothetical protein